MVQNCGGNTTFKLVSFVARLDVWVCFFQLRLRVDHITELHSGTQHTEGGTQKFVGKKPNMQNARERDTHKQKLLSKKPTVFTERDKFSLSGKTQANQRARDTKYYK